MNKADCYIPKVTDIVQWNGRAGVSNLMVLEVDEDNWTFTAYNFTTQRINANGWSYDPTEYDEGGHFVLLG